MRLPQTVHNWISYLGGAMATVVFAVFWVFLTVHLVCTLEAVGPSSGIRGADKHLPQADPNTHYGTAAGPGDMPELPLARPVLGARSQGAASLPLRLP